MFHHGPAGCRRVLILQRPADGQMFVDDTVGDGDVVAELSLAVEVGHYILHGIIDEGHAAYIVKFFPWVRRKHSLSGG